MINNHSFHIPVMGIGYTIDTPLKVSPFGIDSAISLVDDGLIEKLRRMYCEKFEIPYQEITEKVKDFRAARITSYLDLLNELAEKKLEEFKEATLKKSNEIKDYFNMLPDGSELKQEFNKLTSRYFNLTEIRSWIKDNLAMGSIDVNIMTKVDKDNFLNGNKLAVEFNDAHAALRGFANSKLNSSIVLSAGMNPRLYGYIEQFEDFFPDENGNLKKKIVLKVSDYRSALIQGKYLAKKGIWVSEYRIESGLNCGGHAFASDGYLIGPVLAEFRDKREELRQSVYDVLLNALKSKDRTIPGEALAMKITAQGGVGTAEEHQFLLRHYKVDSVGWGTPFLLVPEVTAVDEDTINRLIDAKEEDLYLSDISPLGVPFNSLRGNTKDLEKMRLADQGKPGSNCPKKYVALNFEFTEKGICTASRRYQKLKIEALEKEDLPDDLRQSALDKIVEKSCICVGLGTSALVANDLDTKAEGEGISVCPGPNMAYFSKKMSLKDMTDHIYGRSNMISRTDRPNMFIKELNIYIDFLRDKLEETRMNITKKQTRFLSDFEKNLKDGINYYNVLFENARDAFNDKKAVILLDLENSRKTLQRIKSEIENL